MELQTKMELWTLNLELVELGTLEFQNWTELFEIDLFIII